MIEQSINLYQEKFKPVKVILSAEQMVAIWGVLILVLIGVSYYQFTTKESLLSNEKVLSEQLTSLKVKNTEAQKKIQQLKASASNETKRLEKLEKKIKLHKETLSFLANQKNFHTKAFSKYLIALSKNTTNGLWLEKINIKSNAGYFRLQGQSTVAKLVSVYLESISKDEVFKNINFKHFLINQEDESANYSFSLSTKREIEKQGLVKGLLNAK